jgi:hypothetical protein
MGERCNRTAEVSGSIPLGSTNYSQARHGFLFRAPLCLKNAAAFCFPRSRRPFPMNHTLLLLLISLAGYGVSGLAGPSSDGAASALEDTVAQDDPGNGSDEPT